MGLKKLWLTISILALITIVVSVVVYSNLLVQENSNSPPDRETLFQIAPFNTFSSGRYDGILTFDELANHGDFGIGTFQDLDGEMAAVDGVFYQITINGKPHQVDMNVKTPYATVTFFDPEIAFTVSDPTNYSKLQTKIDSYRPSDDAIYAIKVKGNFDYAQTRSVPAQQKPYPPIEEAVKNQTIFTVNSTQATAVGFWFPASMDGVDYAGYHLHLIADDYSIGGHLLDCIARNVTVEIDQTSKFNLILP
jgi:acetolactate decarboxylase